MTECKVAWRGTSIVPMITKYTEGGLERVRAWRRMIYFALTIVGRITTLSNRCWRKGLSSSSASAARFSLRDKVFVIIYVIPIFFVCSPAK